MFIFFKLDLLFYKCDYQKNIVVIIQTNKRMSSERDRRIHETQERIASLRRQYEDFKDMPSQELMHELYNEIVLDYEERIRSLENDLALLNSSFGRRKKKMITFEVFFGNYRKRHPRVSARKISDKFHKAQSLFV